MEASCLSRCPPIRISSTCASKPRRCFGISVPAMAKRSWRMPHMLETIAPKGGERVGSGQYEVSPDGLTLTITGPEQVIVLVRA